MAVVTDGQTAVIDEVVADKGYHSNQVLVDLGALDLRTYIAEPNRGRRTGRRRRWPGMRCMPIAGASAARVGWLCSGGGANISNGRTHISTKPGGLRRTHVRGHANILKRLLIQQAPQLGLLMRTLIGVGTPRGLQGRLAAVWALVVRLVDTRCRPLASRSHTIRRSRARRQTASSFRTISSPRGRMGPLTTGC